MVWLERRWLRERITSLSSHPSLLRHEASGHGLLECRLLLLKIRHLLLKLLWLLLKSGLLWLLLEPCLLELLKWLGLEVGLLERCRWLLSRRLRILDRVEEIDKVRGRGFRFREGLLRLRGSGTRCACCLIRGTIRTGAATNATFGLFLAILLFAVLPSSSIKIWIIQVVFEKLCEIGGRVLQVGDLQSRRMLVLSCNSEKLDYVFCQRTEFLVDP